MQEENLLKWKDVVRDVEEYLAQIRTMEKDMSKVVDKIHMEDSITKEPNK